MYRSLRAMLSMRHSQAEIGGDGHHRALRDALQSTRRQRRRHQRTVTGHEDVLAGALADEAIGGQHDGLVVAGLQRLNLGQRRVDVVAHRLGGRRHRVVIVTGPRRDLHAHALAHGVVTEVGAPRPAGNGDIDGARQRVEAQSRRSRGRRSDARSTTPVRSMPRSPCVAAINSSTVYGSSKPRILAELASRTMWSVSRKMAGPCDVS